MRKPKSRIVSIPAPHVPQNCPEPDPEGPLPRIVKVDNIPEGYEDKYPCKVGDLVLYLGEIANMPGHCAFVTDDGKVHWGYHTDHFRDATEDEV